MHAIKNVPSRKRECIEQDQEEERVCLLPNKQLSMLSIKSVPSPLAEERMHRARSGVRESLSTAQQAVIDALN
ncbi:hypothetical protein A3194_00350 [Candidatus Thiodiazotropha endoloripes]|nr:hypothetical protein A3194_00350 [Candidatus Thiodiazotropha endoloripes]